MQSSPLLMAANPGGPLPDPGALAVLDLASDGGCYPSWTVPGKIRLAVGKITCQSAGVNGVFPDLYNNVESNEQ